MLELWEMQSSPSSPSFPIPHRPGVVAPDRVLSRELFDYLNVNVLINVE